MFIRVGDKPSEGVSWGLCVNGCKVCAFKGLLRGFSCFVGRFNPTFRKTFSILLRFIYFVYKKKFLNKTIGNKNNVLTFVADNNCF